MSGDKFIVIFTLVLIAHLVAFSTKVKAPTNSTAHDQKIYHITLHKSLIKSKPKEQTRAKRNFLVPPVMIDEPKPKSKPKPIRKKRFLVPPIILDEPKPKAKKHKKKSLKKPQKRIKKRNFHKEKQTISNDSTLQNQPIKTVSTATVDPSLKKRYLRYVREQIRQNLYYPKAAKRLRIEGTVRVGFVVEKSGEVSTIKVLSFPHRTLAIGAKKTLKLLDLKPIPDSVGESRLRLEIPIEFKLNG